MAEEQPTQQQSAQPIKGITPVWKMVIAVIIDLIVGFFVLGYLVAAVTGNTTPEGFKIEGAPALIFFALLATYIYLGYKVWKKSLGQIVMGIKR